MTQSEIVPKLPEMVEGESNLLWGVPDDVLLLLKQYDFTEHVTPTYTVTGSPNGLHFICVWPTKNSQLGDKVLQDIMKIHQITDIKTAEVACQTDDVSEVPIEYPEYQNHEELDIEIEKTEAENECSKSNGKISIASADSGHQPSDEETKIEQKDLDDVTDIEEIEDMAEPIHTIDNIVADSDKHKIVRPGFSNFAAFERNNNNNTEHSTYNQSMERLRNMHGIPQFAPQFQNMPYSGLALLNQQAALRNHQMQIQTNTSPVITKTEYSPHQPVQHQISPIGEPNVRQHLNEIYRKYNIVPKRIQGGTLEEVLRPPMKSQGHRTAHQIHLMRRMREVSSKMNLTDCANPNYEDAVSVLLDSFEITAPYVNAPEYRRKMNFLLRKRINNRRWFLRKKAKGATMSEQMELESSKQTQQQATTNQSTANIAMPPTSGGTGPDATSAPQLCDYFNPLMAAALQAQQQRQQQQQQQHTHLTTPLSGPLIGGTPMIESKVDLTVA